jgi:hypothetical protein
MGRRTDLLASTTYLGLFNGNFFFLAFALWGWEFGIGMQFGFFLSIHLRRL